MQIGTVPSRPSFICLNVITVKLMFMKSDIVELYEKIGRPLEFSFKQEIFTYTYKPSLCNNIF
jgi:hypothetical protein